MTQRTLKTRIDVVGVGLHTGRRIRMEVAPASADTGIRFVRSDLGGAAISLGVGGDARVSRVDHATTLSGEGFTISTVEHLMAALRGLGVDNATVHLSGAEVPIMDGSAAPFVYLVKEAGLKDLGVPRRYLQLKRPVSVLDGDREVTIYPADHFRISYTIDFTHPAIGRQSLSRGIDERTFVKELAPARTFCLLKDVQLLRKRGLALGGSLANAVVVGDQGPLNNLRFHDEFVRHKALDLVGDLALLGHPVLGHVVAHKAGHEMHSRLVVRLLTERDAWTLTTRAHVPVAAATGVIAAASPHAATGLATM
ncbi:MAG TPA: UDP-3-O-acyl-N-acetylglucosamine deacetylase [Candidatus Polarisedimenticolia bacterium]